MDEFNNFKKEDQALFEDFKRKINMQAAQAQIKKLEYNLSDVTSGLAAVKAACNDAATLRLGGVCVRPVSSNPARRFWAARRSVKVR